MGITKTRKTILYIVILIFIIPYGCSDNKNNDIILGYEILSEKDILLEDYYGQVSGMYENSIFLWRNNNLLSEVDIVNGNVKSIGEVGEAPGEYLRPSYTIKCKDYYYIKDSSSNKILIFDSLYNFIDEIKIFEKVSIFKFLNDTLIFYTNTTLLKNFFCIYNINIGEKIFSFGEAINYPISKDSNKLIHNGKIISLSRQWDVRDSLLIWYDYYNNELRAYNIFEGELITTFGRGFNKWSIPPVFEIPGDQYHNTKNDVASSPCENILISDKYIFVCFSKIWEYNWWLRDFDAEKLMEIKSNKYFLVDVYSIDNFNYLGSFYPLDKYLVNGNDLLIVRGIALEKDNILDFYLQDREEGMFFRKITVMVDLTDTILD